MGFTITSRDYVGYLKLAAKKIADNKDYITNLDAITGDGDHWVNINMGFTAMLEAAPELEGLAMDGVFKKIGSIMMSKVGGSSGFLYGGAYMAAAKEVAGKESIGSQELCSCLSAMVNDMMRRGKAEPGFKTMIDALYPAAQAYKDALERGDSDADTLEAVKQAAVSGAESTKSMEAVKGRATYQANKGVGHLDPGAVTMAYQLECLCDYISQNLI